MNKKTILSCAIMGALNMQPMLALAKSFTWIISQVDDSSKKGAHSVSVGVDTAATGSRSVALGRLSKSSGLTSIAIGDESESKTDFSIAIGSKAKNSGLQSISVGSSSESKGESSVAMGKLAQGIGKYSVAIGVNSDSESDYSIGLGSFSRADRKYDEQKLQKISAEQDNKLATKTIREVSLGVLMANPEDSFLGQITHLAPGIEDTDAANIYQLKRLKKDVDGRIGELNKITTTKSVVEQLENKANGAFEAIAKHRNEANQALTETTRHRDDAYDALIEVKGYKNTVNSIIQRLEREASLITGEVTQNFDGTMYLGKELKGSQIFVSGKQGDRVIRGVASGARNSDAVNVSQLNTVRTTANYASQFAQKNSSRINHLEDRLSKANTKIERGLATSAALTGLFQPYGVGKVNFTASIGGYGASPALAVGTGYRITENAAVKAGAAYSDGNHVMYNASFNFEW